MGCALGVLASIATSQIIRSYLFRVSPIDVWLYAASIFLMMGVALVASAVPAIRAASTDPIHALRSVT
jgi:ABC-type antimicrobial peptide transport system permease subunit